MFLVITAIIISIALWFSIQGVIIGTYVLFFFLGLNLILVIYTVSSIVGFQSTILKKSQDHLNVNPENKKDLQLKLLIRFMFLACVWHIFTIGHTFIAGATLITVLISIFVTILQLLEERYLN